MGVLAVDAPYTWDLQVYAFQITEASKGVIQRLVRRGGWKLGVHGYGSTHEPERPNPT